MSYVIRFGSNYKVYSEDDISVTDTLPAKTYVVAFNKMSNEYFLESIDNFVIPSKLYGDTVKKAKRILNTFNDRSASLGVHLDGVKGSGKTLLAKYVATLARENGIPTIVVNTAHCGDEFNKFIQSINVPCVIIFDEFEKVYGYQEQNKILTLFDGVYPTKKLFILTTNDAYSVNNFLKNRPGRIYYSFNFDTLSQDFVREYCEDNLKNKSHIDNILKYTAVFTFFNFDMLSAAIEEMNRYDESLQDVLDYLNIVPENKSSDTYTVTIDIDGWKKVMEKTHRGFNSNNFHYYINPDEDLEEIKDDKLYTYLDRFYDEENDISFHSEQIIDFDPVENVFTFGQSKGGVTIKLIVKRNPNTNFNVNKMLF